MTEYIEVDATHIYETDRAVLLDFGAGEIWVPKSVMENGPMKIKRRKLLSLNGSH